MDINNRILIVDDIPLNRLLIRTFIEFFGYRNIDEASDGGEAIGMVERNEYFFIFMDIQMPVMNGIEATKHIRTIQLKTIPIVAITAYDDIEIEENGFNDLIRKPYSRDRIKTVLDRFVL